MFELFEVVFYTLIQAIRASWLTTFLFLGVAGYYLFKLFQPYFLRSYQRLLSGKSSLSQAIKIGWKNRKGIDWKQVWRQSVRGLFNGMKSFLPKIFALVSLILWNVFFSRFLKEVGKVAMRLIGNRYGSNQPEGCSNG